MRKQQANDSCDRTLMPFPQVHESTNFGTGNVLQHKYVCKGHVSVTRSSAMERTQRLSVIPASKLRSSSKYYRRIMGFPPRMSAGSSISWGRGDKTDFQTGAIASGTRLTAKNARQRTGAMEEKGAGS